MGPRKGSFRARASSIIPSPLATIFQGQFHDSLKGRRPSHSSQSPNFGEKSGPLENIQTGSSPGGHTHTSSGDDFSDLKRKAQRAVRTVPIWVHTRNEIEDGSLQIRQPLPAPNDAYIAQHNSNPAAKQDGISRQRLNLEDSERWRPPWPGASVEDGNSRWKPFTDATAYPRLYSEGGQIVTDEWLREHGPDYYQPWLAGNADGDMDNPKRRAWTVRIERTVLRSPIVPMVIRMVVLGFSVVALGLAGSIHHITNAQGNILGQAPSTDMAIIVDAIAIVYLLYITYDEYSSKPLGLRSARAKMRLIFLDLFFIVFDSANLSLAFAATRGNCNHQAPANTGCSDTQQELFSEVQQRQKALSSVLLIALVAWLLTFSISVTR